LVGLTQQLKALILLIILNILLIEIRIANGPSKNKILAEQLIKNNRMTPYGQNRNRFSKGRWPMGNIRFSTK